VNLSKREKVIVSTGAVIGLFLLAVFIRPLVENGGALGEPLETKKELLERYRRLAGEKTRLEQERETLGEEIGALEGHLFNESTPGLGSAKLQSRLEKIVRLRRADIQSIKTIKPEDAGEYTRIGVEITFYSDANSLLNLLYDIEGDSMGLSVAQLDVHLKNFPGQKRLLTTMRVESGLKRER